MMEGVKPCPLGSRKHHFKHTDNDMKSLERLNLFAINLQDFM